MKYLLGICAVLGFIGTSTWVINIYWPTPPPVQKTLVPQVIPNRITCKLTCSKGTLALEIPIYPDNPVAYDDNTVFLPYLVDGEAKEGVAHGSVPSFTVIQHGKKKSLRFYYLTNRVKKVTARFKNVEEGELRLANEQPYKVELWLNTDQDLLLDFDLAQGQAQ